MTLRRRESVNRGIIFIFSDTLSILTHARMYACENKKKRPIVCERLLRAQYIFDKTTEGNWAVASDSQPALKTSIISRWGRFSEHPWGECCIYYTAVYAEMQWLVKQFYVMDSCLVFFPKCKYFPWKHQLLKASRGEHCIEGWQAQTAYLTIPTLTPDRLSHMNQWLKHIAGDGLPPYQCSKWYLNNSHKTINNL